MTVSNSTVILVKYTLFQEMLHTCEVSCGTVVLMVFFCSIRATVPHLHVNYACFFHSSSDVVNSTSDVAYSSSDVVHSSSDVVHSSSGVVNLTSDVVHSSSDVVNSTSDVVHSSSDIVNSTSDVVHSSSDIECSIVL
jgi:hypothetical protein